MFFEDPYLRSIIEKQFKTLFESEVLKIGISELKVASSSRVTEKLLSGNFEFEIRSNLKIVRNLSANQKCDLFILLRVLRLFQPENDRIKIIYFDFLEIMKKKGLEQSDRYFYLSHLSDKHFELFIYDTFLVKSSLRYFSRRINQKIPSIEEKNLLQVLQQIIEQPLKFVLLSKQKPKRVQRHKGYRDHGSLGSEFSKTLKDQSRDWTVTQLLEQIEAREETYLPFIQGFLE